MTNPAPLRLEAPDPTQPAGAAESVADPPRRELKYLLHGFAGRAGALWVRARIPSLTIQHPSRRVTSAYFDSADYAAYRVSSAGVNRRTKVRLRWYDTLDVATHPTLELKHRLDGRGWKSRYRIDDLDLRTEVWDGIERRIAAAARDRDRMRVAALAHPVLVVTYRRDYLVTTDGRVRVTVDTGLRCFDQRHRLRPNFVFDAAAAGFAVLECKLEAEQPSEAVRILGPLGLRWTRFSKYCWALEALSRGSAAALPAP